MVRKKKGGGPLKVSARGRSAPSKRPSSQSWTQEAAGVSRFSMADEARFLSNHRSRAFEPDRKLRLLRVDFVSAGCLEGTIKELPPPTTNLKPAQSAVESPTTTSIAMENMKIRSPSPSPSDSSDEEVVVFRGRGATPAQQNHKATSAPTPTEGRRNETVATLNIPSGLTKTSKPIPMNDGVASLAGPGTSFSRTEAPPTISEPVIKPGGPNDVSESLKGELTPASQGETGSDSDSIVQEGFAQRRGGKSIWEMSTTPWVSRSKPGVGWLPLHERPDMEAFLEGDVDPADAAMDDYMQNIEDFLPEEDRSITRNTFARRDLDLSGGNDWDSHNLKSIDGDFRAAGADSDWDSVALFDLKSLSTSSDVMETVERVIASRQRKTGMQYLVVYEGSIADDAHWLPVSFLTKPSDVALIEAFEIEMLSREQMRGLESQSESDSEFGGKEEEDGEDDDDDDDDIDYETADIDDDERLARVLQMQEELGLGSSEVLLYAQDEFFDGPIRTPKGGIYGIDRPQKKRQQRSGKRAEPSFPSASAMADILDIDPYNGFDVMDTERPSLRSRKKGRRGQMPPELDDPDLNEKLQASWEADRVTKRLKKADREELRKQGLLGRKGKGPDLSAKYKDGFTMDQVVEEIRGFMISDMTTCSLPPMDAGQRAVIHQFVHQFGVNSRSRGQGLNRFTILSKTARTIQFNDDHFDAVVERKKYKARFQASTRGFQKGNKVRPVVSYKDGEIVGASAPEIGPENRGRALLEKMGWTKGTALGTVDNKGILHPIAHTVKISKAGLK